MGNKRLNGFELSEEQLNQIAGGSNHFTFCCGVCLTPLVCEIVDGALIGFCPTCKCYPENWKPIVED